MGFIIEYLENAQYNLEQAMTDSSLAALTGIRIGTALEQVRSALVVLNDSEEEE